MELAVFLLIGNVFKNAVFSFKIHSFTFANILHDFLSALLFFSVLHVLELQLLLVKPYCCSWQLIKNIQNSKKFKISLRQVPLSQGFFPKFKALREEADLTVVFTEKAIGAHVHLLLLKVLLKVGSSVKIIYILVLALAKLSGHMSRCHCVPFSYSCQRFQIPQDLLLSIFFIQKK